MTALLQVSELDVRHGLLQAVRQVSFELAEGETLALVGANGAGKSTLLRAIAGAHRPAAGRLVFEGRDITAMAAHRRVKAGIALVPEGRRLFPNLSVEENLRVASASGRCAFATGRAFTRSRHQSCSSTTGWATGSRCASTRRRKS